MCIRDSHISFDNHFLHIPPQYNPLYASKDNIAETSVPSKDALSHIRPALQGPGSMFKIQSQQVVPQTIHTKKENPFGASSWSLDPQKEAMYRSRSESPMQARRKQLASGTIAKLPPPPEKSVLKKVQRRRSFSDIEDIDLDKLDLEMEKKMVQVTQNNTAKNSGSRKGYTQDLFANLNEVEDRIGNKRKNIPPEKKRAKSFAGMTDAELAQLEEFYISKGRSATSAMEKYDFGEQAPSNQFNDYKTDSANIPIVNKAVYDSLTLTYPSRPSITYLSLIHI